MGKKNIILKIALLGDPAVGKTSLINRFTEESFKDDYQPTLGVNIIMKKLMIDDFNVQLAIWDIAGQDKYELTRKLFFEGCSGALLVYDLTRNATIDRIKSKWAIDFSNYARPDGIYILIGNKDDLKDSVTISSEKGREIAKEIIANNFIETSAKSGDNVERAFEGLVSQILKNFNL